MSHNVPRKHVRKALRLKRIRELLPKGATYEEIASSLDVSEKTVDRDIKEWEISGGFEEWLRQEFFRLHHKVKDKDEMLAYKVVAGLLEKTLKQKMEAEVKGSITLMGYDFGKKRTEPSG